ncbi:hypothetical protein QVD17_14978 [Tagetes erecta]|uniref:Uncharacterized protein n=1 Tax=Tagetes erecta TaxID=13708 RepID=A0AAD8KNV3_TARER|nr:hypothetical protein QVD17_14978 [Tagetes erecta]
MSPRPLASSTFDPLETTGLACGYQTMVLSGILSYHMDNTKLSFPLILLNPKAKSPEGESHGAHIICCCEGRTDWY